MKKEDIQSYFVSRKKVHLTCIFGEQNSINDPDPKNITRILYYEGFIQKLNDEILIILDKFNHLVTIEIANIKKIEEIG